MICQLEVNALHMRSTAAAGTLYLLATAIIFGSSFFIVKNSVDVLAPCWLIGIRFTLASVFLCLVFIRRLRSLNRGTVKAGIIIGIFLLAAYVAQTIGITDTTPGRNAFLTALYVVIVPFLAWIVFRRRPDRYSVIAAGICVAGIALISLDGGLGLSAGDLLSILCAVLFAAQIIAIAVFARDYDPALLTIVQLGFCGIGGFILGVLFEPAPPAMTPGMLTSIAYLSIVVSGLAFLMQNVGQTMVSPSLASILLSLEAVFGVLFSVLFYGEQLTVRIAVGFILVFCATLISETKLYFLRTKRTAA